MDEGTTNPGFGRAGGICRCRRASAWQASALRRPDKPGMDNDWRLAGNEELFRGAVFVRKRYGRWREKVNGRNNNA